MSVVIDPQIQGVADDGSPSGAVRTVPSAGEGVWVPLRDNRYVVENAGSTASFQATGIIDNPDGSGQGLNISVPNTLGQGVRLWIPFVGRLFGVRWRRLTTTTPYFDVAVDGDPVRVSGRNDRLIADGVSSGSMTDQGIAITHDNLDPTVQHYAEISVAADVGGSARALLLFGWVLDRMAGHVPSVRSKYVLSAAACPTSATAITQPTGNNAVIGCSHVIYYNSSGGSLDVTVEWGGTAIWKKSIAAGGVEVFDFGNGGVVGMNSTFKHTASGSGIVATVIGGH